MEPYLDHLPEGDYSIPWQLVSPDDKSGPALVVTYSPGCGQIAVVQVEESAEAVVVRVVRHEPPNPLLCLTTRIEVVPLRQSLGQRPLLHAAASYAVR